VGSVPEPELAPGGVEGVVTAVRGDNPGEALADELGQLAPVAVGGDVERRVALAEGAPRDAPLARLAPAGLIDADDRRILDLLARLAIGRGERAARALADRVHRADRDGAAEELGAQLRGIAP
jgi:hypothetical protein